MTVLLKSTNDMSIMQLTAYHTIRTVYKTVTSGLPGYLAERLKLRAQEQGVFPRRQQNKIEVPQGDLTLTRGGFLYRGATLWNMLPDDMRMGMKDETFKTALRRWVKGNIKPKPP